MPEQKYSVLMAIYIGTSLKQFRQSVDSMLAQTVRPEQFVLVFDGPVNALVQEEVNRYVQAEPNLFTIVPLTVNQGLAAALNHGIDAARNELIARMDSDDISFPDRCEKQLAAFAEDGELALLGTAAQEFTGEPVTDEIKLRRKPISHEEIKKTMRRNNPFIHSTVMFKKSAVTACGKYDQSMRRRQDHDLFSRMVSMGYKAGNLGEPLLYFRSDDAFIKRNRNKETCNARMTVQKRIFRRGECSLWDFLYVWLAMAVSRWVPAAAYRKIYSMMKNDS